MRNNEIAKLTGLSQSTICRILQGKGNFSKEKVLLVNQYKNFEEEQIGGYFRDKRFEILCDIVIADIKKDDYKDINKMLRYTTECVNWHYILNIKEFKIVRRTPMALFRDDMFFLMCDIAIKRCKNIDEKKWILNLQNLHINFNYKTK